MPLRLSLKPVLIASLVTLSAPGLAQERSFIGKRLPDIAWTDTEGHSIRPANYLGSVLVLMTGIPW